MNSNSHNRQFFFERVVLGKGKLGYSFPDVIGSPQAEQLAALIDSDDELWNMAYSQDATAEQIWNKLSQTPLGSALKDAHPDIVKYRISAARKGKDAFVPGAYKPQREGDEDSTSQMDYYDKWANEEGGQHLQGQGMPSFKEFFDPTKASKWRPNEVSGAGSKQTPVDVATQKQNPVEVPPKRK